jgi:ferredoxin
MNPAAEAFEVVLFLPSGEERSIRVGANDHIWDAAFASGVILPALCHQGYCLTCAARMQDGGAVDQSDSLTYFPEDREAGFVLLCTGKARSPLHIRTHQQQQMRQHRRKAGLPAPYLVE